MKDLGTDSVLETEAKTSHVTQAHRNSSNFWFCSTSAFAMLACVCVSNTEHFTHLYLWVHLSRFGGRWGEVCRGSSCGPGSGAALCWTQPFQQYAVDHAGHSRAPAKRVVEPLVKCFRKWKNTKEGHKVCTPTRFT